MGPRGHRGDRLHEDTIFMRKLLTSWFKQTRGKMASLVWRRICLQCRRPRFDPWVGKSPWSNPPQCSCLENPVDRGAYGPWGHKESDTTEWLTLWGRNKTPGRQPLGFWFGPPSPGTCPLPTPVSSWCPHSHCFSEDELKSGLRHPAAVSTWGHSQVTFPGVGRCSF